MLKYDIQVKINTRDVKIKIKKTSRKNIFQICLFRLTNKKNVIVLRVFRFINSLIKELVAQWTRARGYEPRGRGFKSLLAQEFIDLFFCFIFETILNI